MALAVCCLFCRPVFSEDQANADMKNIQGTWLFTKIIEDGAEMPSDDPLQSKGGMEFEAGAVYTIADLKRDQSAGKFELKPSKNSSTPGEIKMIPPADKGDKQKVIHGIYKLDGDVLTICQSDGDDTPSDFKSDRHHIVYQLKRRVLASTRP